MAGGWAKDGAVQEQIDASLEDAIKRARDQMPTGKGLSHCEECEQPIPEARQLAVPGVRLCVSCQSEIDEQTKRHAGNNRCGSKARQLR